MTSIARTSYNHILRKYNNLRSHFSIRVEEIPIFNVLHNDHSLSTVVFTRTVLCIYNVGCIQKKIITIAPHHLLYDFHSVDYFKISSLLFSIILNTDVKNKSAMFTYNSYFIIRLSPFINILTSMLFLPCYKPKNTVTENNAAFTHHL